MTYNKPKPIPFWLLLALILIVLDQASKWYFELHFAFGERVNLLPFFDFILVYNTGAAFSFGAGAGGWQRWAFIGLGLAACAFILYLLNKNRGKPLFCTAITLIFAGALGNVIDRVVLGHVIDFLLFYWDDWGFYFPAFNLADCFITVGTTLIIVEEIFFSRKKTEEHLPS
ncbi:signal peptidase II [Pelistega europaea]|uniref:Lipoprotein signal peptidase n=1 Tax=Pelistega europaea TaxID=106147 RepID=A0A7Y4L8Z4_9BURK|nr:signal peptidase II [Pelistega europaea]NOL49088.1 lipoprotein signal peptidase [Pelistega europaea]